MPFLSIAGNTVEVLDESAVEDAPTIIGDFERAADGTMRSSVRGVKRSWSFTTMPITPAAHATLRAAILAGSGIVSCAGDALGASVDCFVEMDSSAFRRDITLTPDFRRSVALKLHEA